MKEYVFFTKTDNEGVREHRIRAESAKKAYLLLKESGYGSYEITLSGWKEA